eukprot:TRINITY_DN14920_c0_g1_i3.p1 TRINITY_DN14920_c0_g1~~TRINITY_DN14920_c0_g1_i3.p1  ORF type:complete len:245 (+),score=23.41 TRINITY_DN14920_c0_g1_i3:62-796(+)
MCIRDRQSTWGNYFYNFRMSQFAYDFNASLTTKPTDKPINAGIFTTWTKDQQFRTSYQQNFANAAAIKEPTNYVIPRYDGYVPGYVPDNMYGKSKASLSREAFANPELGKNKFGLSTSGYNYQKWDPSEDDKLGKNPILNVHPALRPKKFISETREIFSDPSKQVPPTFRETPLFLENSLSKTRTSGYNVNSDTFDGKGWKPHNILNGDRTKTEYRAQYNTEKPYHRNTELLHLRSTKNKLSKA